MMNSFIAWHNIFVELKLMRCFHLHAHFIKVKPSRESVHVSMMSNSECYHNWFFGSFVKKIDLGKIDLGKIDL